MAFKFRWQRSARHLKVRMLKVKLFSLLHTLKCLFRNVVLYWTLCDASGHIVSLGSLVNGG